jgi:hypothetical protein
MFVGVTFGSLAFISFDLRGHTRLLGGLAAPLVMEVSIRLRLVVGKLVAVLVFRDSDGVWFIATVEPVREVRRLPVSGRVPPDFERARVATEPCA